MGQDQNMRYTPFVRLLMDRSLLVAGILLFLSPYPLTNLCSYDYLYFWDTRSGEMVSTQSFSRKDEDADYPITKLFFINSECELLAYRARPAQLTTYAMMRERDKQSEGRDGR